MSQPLDSSPKKDGEEKKGPILEPIDDVINNLRSQGKDKFQIAYELKQMGYKSRDITSKTGVSSRDIGVKLKATDVGTPQELIDLLTNTQIFEQYGKYITQLNTAELIQLVETRMYTRFLDERARKHGFYSTADYIRTATNFYDVWKPIIAEKLEQNEIQLPMLKVMIENE
jgi:hypothetical protein